MCVCVYVCMCVYLRKREKEGERRGARILSLHCRSREKKSADYVGSCIERYQRCLKSSVALDARYLTEKYTRTHTYTLSLAC